MTIEETDLAKARAAWDACLLRERDACQLQERVMLIRDELKTAFNRLDSAWSNVRADEGLREALDAQVTWLLSNVPGTGPVDPAIETLRYLTELTGLQGGRPSKAKASGVSIDAIRAVARALGLRSYGSSQRNRPLPDERQLLEVCKALDSRVTLGNVRSALKAP